MRRLLTILLFLASVSLHPPAFAATFAEKNLEQLTTEAEQIFVGTVSALKSQKLSSGAIVTDASFFDLQWTKGADLGAQIVLRMLGGEVGGSRLEIPGLPQFVAGVRYLVFVRGNGKDMFPVVGGPAGVFRVDTPSSGAAAKVSDSTGAPLPPQLIADIAGRTSAPPLGATAVSLAQFLDAIESILGGK